MKYEHTINTNNPTNIGIRQTHISLNCTHLLDVNGVGESRNTFQSWYGIQMNTKRQISESCHMETKPQTNWVLRRSGCAKEQMMEKMVTRMLMRLTSNKKRSACEKRLKPRREKRICVTQVTRKQKHKRNRWNVKVFQEMWLHNVPTKQSSDRAYNRWRGSLRAWP